MEMRDGNEAVQGLRGTRQSDRLQLPLLYAEDRSRFAG